MRRTTPIPINSLRVAKTRAGLGLFAKHALKPGQYLEYVGPHISSADADLRPHAKYYFEINSRWIIDGSTRENIARYVNHNCRPNAEALIVGKRIFYRLNRALEPGDEITIDYGPEYFDAFIKPMGCKCTHCASKQRHSE